MYFLCHPICVGQLWQVFGLQYFYMAAGCTILLWHVISVKLNFGKKIIVLETMTWNRKKIYYVSKLIELMFKGELQCLQVGPILGIGARVCFLGHIFWGKKGILFACTP